MTDETTTCAKCGNAVSVLATFPGGICVNCYAKTPEANREVTAEELASMWKGSVNVLKGKRS